MSRPAARPAHRRDRRGRGPPGRTRDRRGARTSCTRRAWPATARRRSSSTRRPRARRESGRSRRWTASCSAAAPTSTRRATAVRTRARPRSNPTAMRWRRRPGPPPRRAAVPVLGHLPRVPGDQRLLGRNAAPARRRAMPARAGVTGPALTHPLRVAPGTRLARILFPTNARGGVVEVNSYHHQAVRASDLAPGLVATPGRAARPATSSRASRRPTAASSSASSAIRSAPSPRRRPSSACSRSSSTRREARSAGASGGRARPALDELPASMMRWRNWRVRASCGSLKIWPGGPSSRIRAGVEEADAVRDVPREAHLVGRDDHRHAAERPARG